jgi:hypothetical protein
MSHANVQSGPDGHEEKNEHRKQQKNVAFVRATPKQQKSRRGT